MTKEMYKAQYRKEIYEKTLKEFRLSLSKRWPIIDIRQFVMVSVLFDEQFCDNPEQKAALDEIGDEMSAEFEVYKANRIVRVRKDGTVLN